MILGDGWVYVCVQKTASLATSTWLKDHYGGQEKQPYHGVKLPKSHTDALVIMGIREPYDRALSWWRFRCHKGRPTDKPPLKSLPTMTSFAESTGACIFLRFEDGLDNELRRLPFFDPKKPMPQRINVTPRYRELVLSEDDRRDVRERYARDFEVFGYDL